MRLVRSVCRPGGGFGSLIWVDRRLLKGFCRWATCSDCCWDSVTVVTVLGGLEQRQGDGWQSLGCPGDPPRVGALSSLIGLLNSGAPESQGVSWHQRGLVSCPPPTVLISGEHTPGTPSFLAFLGHRVPPPPTPISGLCQGGAVPGLAAAVGRPAKPPNWQAPKASTWPAGCRLFLPQCPLQPKPA